MCGPTRGPSQPSPSLRTASFQDCGKLALTSWSSRGRSRRRNDCRVTGLGPGSIEPAMTHQRLLVPGNGTVWCKQPSTRGQHPSNATSLVFSLDEGRPCSTTTCRTQTFGLRRCTFPTNIDESGAQSRPTAVVLCKPMIDCEHGFRYPDCAHHRKRLRAVGRHIGEEQDAALASLW